MSKWLRIAILILLPLALIGQVVMIFQRHAALKREDAEIERTLKDIAEVDRINAQTYANLCRTYLKLSGPMPQYCNADGTYNGTRP